MRIVLLAAAVLGLVASALAAPVAAKKAPPGQAKKSQTASANKTWICHLAAKKYVAIRVSNKALPAHQRHGDDITATVPQTRAEAREFCAGQQVLTPRRGGSQRVGSLTNANAAGVAATLRVRARLGQGEVCFRLTLTGATGATALTLTKGAAEVPTTPTLTSLLDSGTTSTGCAEVSRETVRQLLRTPGDFGATVVATTAGGPVTLTGALAR